MNVPDLDIVQIRDPAAYRDACVRNEEIDEWRRRRVADRMEVGRKIYGEMLRRLAEEEERWVHGLGRVVAVADRCPTNGADDLVRWLETGESPPSSDPGRAAWDKRVQRARAWVSARLPTEFRPYLKRRVRPPRPTERQAYLRACEEIGPGGTHFYGQAIETIRWQCYDQIIVSADFAGLVGKPTVLSELSGTRLVVPKSARPRRDEVSDHLPVRIMFAPEGVPVCRTG